MSKMVQDYMLVDVIGSGQYGKVWKAEHMKTKEQFAIKSISIQQISGVDKLKEFVMNEISALEIIASRHIVKYYGKLQTTNNIYLIFEFCKGGTLEDVIKKHGMLSESQALTYFDQILIAFQELHRLFIMHRDLKPSNVLMQSGEVKLADFGFCKKMKGEFEMTKSIVGSPIYMAPELLQGRYYCTKADIWSLGVMLYEMLHGKCPYEENSIPALLEKIKSTDLKIMSGLSHETKQLLIGMLSFNPTTRIGWNDLFRRVGGSSSELRTSNRNISYGSSLDGQKKELNGGNLTQSYLPGISRDSESGHNRYGSSLGHIGLTDPFKPKAYSGSNDASSKGTLNNQEEFSPTLDTRSDFGLKDVNSYANQTTTLKQDQSYSNSQSPQSRFGNPQHSAQSFLNNKYGNQTSYQNKLSSSDERDFQEVLKSCPLIMEVNSRLEQNGLPPLPLDDMKSIIARNKRSEHDDFFEILKNRYCVKYIMDKVKLFYLLDFEDQVWQNHVVLLMFKRAKKYMLTAKIKVAYADINALRDMIMEPQQLVEYVDSENTAFETLYAQFLKELSNLVREDKSDKMLQENLERPFDLDEGHFKAMITKTVKKIKQMNDENGISVANFLLDIYMMDSFMVKLIDFREKDKYFENFNNRLTNRELREVVDIKLDLIG